MVKYRHWNGMMLRADVMLLGIDVMLLGIDVMLLLIHTCMRWRYITVLRYMSVPTLMIICTK